MPRRSQSLVSASFLSVSRFPPDGMMLVLGLALPSCGQADLTTCLHDSSSVSLYA